MVTQTVAGFDLDLLDQINDLPLAAAGGRCADWGPVLARLRANFRADGGVLMTLGPNSCAKLDLLGFDEGAWADYAGHFQALDPFVLALRTGRLGSTGVSTVDDLVPARVLAGSEYYNDFWRPLGIAHEIGAVCASADGLRLHLALPRGPWAGRYDSGDKERFSVYSRHLFRALQLTAAVLRNRGPDLDAFARRYGLTPAESRLVEALGAFGKLTAAAERLRRRHNTVRAQLRSIFAKTGVDSQVALMTLLHRAC